MELPNEITQQLDEIAKLYQQMEAINKRIARWHQTSVGGSGSLATLNYAARDTLRSIESSKLKLSDDLCKWYVDQQKQTTL